MSNSKMSKSAVYAVTFEVIPIALHHEHLWCPSHEGERTYDGLKAAVCNFFVTKL